MTKHVTRLGRRGFLKGAVATAAAAVAAPTIIPASAIGRDGAVPPSERVVVGGIGIGNRGTYDLGCFLEQKDVQFAAVCDVKEQRRIAVKKRADELYGNSSCLMFRDFRELLDRGDIDAVLIATGPNWHATMAIQAAKAGKSGAARGGKTGANTGTGAAAKTRAKAKAATRAGRGAGVLTATRARTAAAKKTKARAASGGRAAAKASVRPARGKVAGKRSKAARGRRR